MLYSDGIVETRGKTPAGAWEEYGSERLLAMARSRQGATARELVEADFADLEAFNLERLPGERRSPCSGLPPDPSPFPASSSSTA